MATTKTKLWQKEQVDMIYDVLPDLNNDNLANVAAFLSGVMEASGFRVHLNNNILAINLTRPGVAR